MDAWSAQLEARRRGLARVQRVLLLIAVGSIGLLVTTGLALFFFVFLGAAAGLIASTHVEHRRLLCPNCGKPPGRAGLSLADPIEDCCPHCYYWLKSPYASHKNDDP